VIAQSDAASQDRRHRMAKIKGEIRDEDESSELLKAQPRFFTAALVGALLWFVSPHHWRASTRLLVA
jgi:hypothetical protein